MFNENDIVTRLMNGESADAIAKEFSEMLNAANKKYSENQKAAENEKKKDILAKAILDNMVEYIKLFCPSAECEEITVQDVKDCLDGIIPLANELNNINAALAKFTPTSIPSSKTDSSDFDKIRQFLKDFDLISD
jgi:hypothetical protein